MLHDPTELGDAYFEDVLRGEQATEPDDVAPGRRVTLTPASAIKPRPVKWLWHHRIALGTLALLGGREGIGKSILTYQLSADITRGQLPGVHHGTPRAVLICATEDSWSHTIVPRLMAAGADLDRVYRIDVTTSEGIAGTLSLPADLGALEVAVTEVDAAAIVLDPLLSRLRHRARHPQGRRGPCRSRTTRRSRRPDRDRHRRADPRQQGDHRRPTHDADGIAGVRRCRPGCAVRRRRPGRRVRPAAIPRPAEEQPRVDRSPVARVHDRVEPRGRHGRGRGLDRPRRMAGRGRPQHRRRAPHRRPNSDRAHRRRRGAGWLVDYLTIHPIVRSDEAKAAAKDYGHKEHTLKRARREIGAGTTGYGFPRHTWWSQPGLTPVEVKSWLDQSEQTEGAQSEQFPGETHQLVLTVPTEVLVPRSETVGTVGTPLRVPTREVPTVDGERCDICGDLGICSKCVEARGRR